jgi:hypothetical protein
MKNYKIKMSLFGRYLLKKRVRVFNLFNVWVTVYKGTLDQIDSYCKVFDKN